MMKRLTAICLVGFVSACLAVDFEGPGGDMASPNNWPSSTLPGTSDAVAFGSTAVPSTGLTLSDHVTFGATTINAGFADGLLVNLAGYSYNGGALSVKSDATFQNGFFTNTTLSVAQDKTLTVSGASGDCTMKLTDSCMTTTSPFSSDSRLHVTDGATFIFPDQFVTQTSGTTIRFDKDSTLDAVRGDYNRAFQYKNVANVTLVVDHATAKFFTLNVGGKENGDLGMVSNSLFSFRNGATVSFNGATSRGFHLGSFRNGANNTSGDIDGCAKSNLVEFIDSTVTTSNKGLHLNGNYNTVVVRNSTFALEIDTHGMSRGNTISLLGSSSFSKPLTLRGMTNVFVQAGGTASGTTAVNGTTNRLEMSGGTRTGAVTMGGRNGVFNLSGGLFKAALTMNGISNVYEHVSGVSTGNVTVAGLGNTLYFRGGTHWGQYRQALVFNESTTNNTVVIDDAEFIHHGTFGKSYANNVGYPYTNCPNCAIEFRGAAPKFRVTSGLQSATSTPWYTVNLGNGTEPMQDPLRLRFVLPETPYESAPFTSEVSNRNTALEGNAVIEVDDSNLPRSHGKLRYPLIYAADSFSNGAEINVDSLNAVNRALGTIGENMTLVRDGGTLYVEIKSNLGSIIVVH